MSYKDENINESLNEQDLRFRSESIAGDVDNAELGDSWISDPESPSTTSSASSGSSYKQGDSLGSTPVSSSIGSGPKDSSQLSSIEFNNALSNVHFPASREELIQQVSNNNNSSQITSILKKLPQQQFNSVNEVQQAYKKVSGGY